MALIEKIQIIPRRLIRDERGWFLKVITGKEERLPSYTGEIYLTMGTPGHIKGGHYHDVATEWFTLIEGNAILMLEEIQTHETMNLSLGLEDAVTIVVPPGIAHAFKNTSNQDFIVLAYTDKLYDPNDTIKYDVKE